MAASENMLSVDAQHVLQDMVELEMYLLSQPQQTPWPMLPRRNKKPPQAREAYSNPVESSTAKELVVRGFIEATSSRTFVVSKSGYQFYEREMKPHSSTINKGQE
uniref:Uncharacterized protein n=1 Tax=Solibacter usitatus (strain Ellin6076) TaxID=234267 RepID=Q01RI5_SOLUE